MKQLVRRKEKLFKDATNEKHIPKRKPVGMLYHSKEDNVQQYVHMFLSSDNLDIKVSYHRTKIISVWMLVHLCW